MASPVEGDIYLIFDKNDKTMLKAMGTMTDSSNFGNSINDTVVNTSVDDEKKILKEKFSAKTASEFNNDDSVIVKLEDNGKIIYIPGFVVDTNGGSGPFKIGVESGRTITNVPKENIVKNRKLESGEKGWFFSDVVLGQVVKGKTDNKELDYTEYKKGIPAIIVGSGLIEITGENGDKYTHTGFKLTNSNDIAENTAKFKSVVPHLFNKENAGKLESSDSKTVFGGKKTNTKKTRKNTMPLQFAPGAKRAYLKRRKSSRK
jgi:hypothetical protein